MTKLIRLNKEKWINLDAVASITIKSHNFVKIEYREISAWVDNSEGVWVDECCEIKNMYKEFQY